MFEILENVKLCAKKKKNEKYSIELLMFAVLKTILLFENK